MREHANAVLRTSPASSTLYDVLDLVLDKGLVVDLYARLSIVGLEVLAVDARVAIASVDTYLRFAAAVNRLDLDAEHGGLGAGLGGALLGGLGKAAGKVIEKGAEKTAEIGKEALGKAVDVAEEAFDKTVDRAAEHLRDR